MASHDQKRWGVKHPNRVSSRTVAGKPRKRLGLPRGMWHPQLVGVVFNYPKTQEAWQLASDRCRAKIIKQNAEHPVWRRGIPDGWAGRREDLQKAHDAAKVKAAIIMAKLKKAGIIEGDDARADALITAMVEVVLAKGENPETGEDQYMYSVRDRTAATNSVLPYLRSKPVQKTDVTVRNAEDFLTALADETDAE